MTSSKQRTSLHKSLSNQLHRIHCFVSKAHPETYYSLISAFKYTKKQNAENYFCVQFWCIHCIISFRITPSNPTLWQFDLNPPGPLMHKCLYWVIVPTGFGARIIVMLANGVLGHTFLYVAKRCLSDSRFLDVWMSPLVFTWLEFVACFVMFMLELAPVEGFSEGGPRI